ncbi:MAG: radical SAM protein [Chlorobi bacterium]|nr:radical SAM protein [Chlorobiota bacterium]
MHVTGRRYFAVNFDPVLACNLRCKMCYFSDKEKAKTLKGIFPEKDLALWAERSLPRALKLQIGCGAEPTLYPALDKVIALGKAYGVPHISLTTNAQTVTYDRLRRWAEAGLDEITVSLHGVKEPTYTYFMDGARYEHFHRALEAVTRLKQIYPDFVLRVNYTFNEDNFDELEDFFRVFGKYAVDVLQLRPIQKLGRTAYRRFDLGNILPRYDDFIRRFRREAESRGVVLMAPASAGELTSESKSSVVYDYTFFYVSPDHFWKKDYDWKNEPLEAYMKRISWGRQLLKPVLLSEKEIAGLLRKQNLNYEVTL